MAVGGVVAASATSSEQPDAARGKPNARLGDCPRHPTALPPSAVGDAAQDALAEVPTLYDGINTRGAIVTVAARASSAGVRGRQVQHQCGKRTQARTVVVALAFPRMRPSASLSQGTIFVSLLGGRYRAWEVAH